LGLDSVDKAVILFFERNSGKWLLKKKPEITLNSKLDEDLLMVWEDVVDLAEMFFEEFNVDGSEFDVFEYMGEGPPLIAKLSNFIKGGEKVKNSKAQLTVGMFSDAAKSGVWSGNK
jgi:hypothetical protein